MAAIGGALPILRELNLIVIIPSCLRDGAKKGETEVTIKNIMTSNLAAVDTTRPLRCLSMRARNIEIR